MFEPFVDRSHAALSNDVQMSPPKDSERGAAAKRNGRGGAPPEASGVLSNLPRTRPQRSSARRAAARDATAAEAARAVPAHSNGHSPSSATKRAVGSPKKPATPRRTTKAPAGTSNPTPAPAAKRRPAAAKANAGGPVGVRARNTNARAASASASTERAPRQGFECDGERSSGSVHPPGGAELVASAAEIVSELAKAGLSTGERVLRDVLSRLPLS
jgi:hypothetical protein